MCVLWIEKDAYTYMKNCDDFCADDVRGLW